ncbi:dimethyl sulfoxide reductase anchor subunit [Jannaschia sp. Os4]|uniref:dimethyl sulfoxide reductase anchor subunit family protein n=1 Tax=Jannaschia sp. Os4 TaxID=2807617 RepID=UPI001939884F|nr:DmsC/YnfH family molybdoenzyme membrane anchor subunit [Jannaschia sp. Os4]MBM2577981.1 dimethyl sulfoxide reductase anchor subunit [Jannaschia sp. Os4]
MHPAPSVIIFSSLSGAGFGLLVFLGLMPDPPRGWVAFVFFALAYALAVGGLLSATFHLKNKKNAWKAYREWRSSWLSREMWAAIAALLVMAAYAAALVFLDLHLAPLGWIGALLSLAVVFTTSMIYAQLRTVPRWNQRATPALFLTAALAGGALLAGRPVLSLILLVALGILQAVHWTRGDRRFAEVGSTLNTATRLPGMVRQFERPQTGENYLTREMVYQVGRKHAATLRVIAIALMAVIPAILMALYLVTDGAGLHHAMAGVAVLSHLIGVLVSRWLFFAEAEHVVGLYYGAHAGVARAA